MALAGCWNSTTRSTSCIDRSGIWSDVTAYVFICYSHEHDREYVEQLAAFLTNQGIPVWFDREIAGGSRWADVIAEKIDESAAMIVVMSPGAAKSRWVGREIGRAEEGDKAIIPL